ncbi:MAG: acyl-CoA thioesterase II [Pseudomonadota bacterium]|nr:acyl-CoA thioesterase II [Pseudomonadota bacterium]
MSAKLSELLGLLDLEQIDSDIFRASHPRSRTKRLFGGQIMAQALMAAIRTVDLQRFVHSLHGYFLRPGDPFVAAIIRIERTRDGGSFSTRRVLVTQRGETIFSMDASFQVQQPGLSHQLSMPDLSPPQPEKIPPALMDAAFVTWRHEFRRLQSETPQPPEQFVWFKVTADVPIDPALHTCLLVYESDTALLGTARLPHRGRYHRDRMQVASLDHAMWFHRPCDINQWLLYAIDSPSTGAARGYTRGSIFTEDGTLIASTVQEGLIRVPGD